MHQLHHGMGASSIMDLAVPVLRQVLVRLDNSKTYLLHVPSFSSSSLRLGEEVPSSALDECRTSILNSLSASTSIPVRHLRITTPPTSSLWSDAVPHLSASFHLPLRGGKGGFGTLLKGQSKQAGAKTTLDFGACRDLSGRRLRHINDEVKLRRWRDAQVRRDRGLPVDELEELRTESGIRNWHLMVPSWADGAASSNKARRKADMAMKREVDRWKSAEEREKQRKDEARARQQMAVAEYVRAGEVAASGGTEEESKKDKVLEIMMQKKKKNRKRGREEEKRESGDDADDDGNDGPDAKRASDDLVTAALAGAITNDEAVSYLCTLSGDIIVDDVHNIEPNTKKVETQARSDAAAPAPSPTGSTEILLQSQSEFATAAVLLSQPLPVDAKGLYYEVKIRTGGLAQIGWAYAAAASSGEFGLRQFRPNSDTGDGVGDDDGSFGYDGYRGLAFHAGEEKAVVVAQSPTSSAAAAWKDGDVVGCTFDASRGAVSYSLNGNDIGVTFDVKKSGSDSKTEPALFPAVSLNQGEIMQINVGPHFEAGAPAASGYLAVCELIDWAGADDDPVKRSDEKSEKEVSTSAAASSALTAAGAAKGSTLVISSPGLILPPVAPIEADTNVAKAEPGDAFEKKGGVRKNFQEQKVMEQAPFDLESCKSLSEAKELGMDRLKEILLSLGCKCGGSLDERAERLFSLKGLKREDYPKKVRGKKFVV